MGQIKELTQEITYNNPVCPSRSYPPPSPLWCHVELYNSVDIKSPLHMYQVQQIIYYSNNKDQARRKTQ